MINHQTNNDNEIDLKELFLILWRGKLYILVFTFLAVFLASMHLRSADSEYLVEFKLKPVGETQQKNSFSGLGGFASLAGIQLPSNTTTDFMIFKELVASVEVSEIIFENKKIIKEIYAGEWNSTLNSFSEPAKSKRSVYINYLKEILIGSKEKNYMPPNPRRLANYIGKNIKINEDKDTGFFTIKTETSKPDMLMTLISEVIQAGDKIMRQRYINFSKEPLAFYKSKLRTSRSREHREALAELIGKEEQRLMFASKGKYFTVEPYMNPTISLYPTAPKPNQVILLHLIIGFLAGCGIVLLRNVILKLRNSNASRIK